jgi:hypothetical protein
MTGPLVVASSSFLWPGMYSRFSWSMRSRHLVHIYYKIIGRLSPLFFSVAVSALRLHLDRYLWGEISARYGDPRPLSWSAWRRDTGSLMINPIINYSSLLLPAGLLE